MKDLETEDVLLVASILSTILAAWLDFMLGSAVFKVVKLAAPFVTLALAIHKIRTGKPFVKDVTREGWTPIEDGFEYRIPRSEHKRGKQPKPRLLVEDRDGYAEGSADMIVNADGVVIYRVGERFPIRAEIRK
jgi:hypothetical protein